MVARISRVAERSTRSRTVGATSGKSALYAMMVRLYSVSKMNRIIRKYAASTHGGCLTGVHRKKNDRPSGMAPNMT